MINEGTHRPGAGQGYVIFHKMAGLWGSKDWTPIVERARLYDREMAGLAVALYYKDDRHNLSILPVHMDSEGQYACGEEDHESKIKEENNEMEK
jgi:hypothetical protein